MYPLPHFLRLLRAVEREERSSKNLLRLTAYESKPSRLVSKLASSPLGIDYHLGSISDHKSMGIIELHGLTLRGLPAVSDLEAEAVEFAKDALSSADVEFRPLSGVHAVMSTLITYTDPGDVVFSINPEHGGHFATRYILERIGRQSEYLPWHSDNYTIDVDGFAIRHGGSSPKLILFDHGMPLAPQPVRALRDVVGDRTIIVYDASHTLGLIIAGRFQDPLNEGADIVQGNTHKSFPGVQKAIIASRSDGLAKEIRSALSNGLISSQHTHHSLATYVAFLEMKEFGPAYADAMLSNAWSLAENLEKLGALLIGPKECKTGSHEILVSPGTHLPATVWASNLIRMGISVNARRVYGIDAIRIGVQSVTRLGMGPSEMRIIARLLMACATPDWKAADDTLTVSCLVGDFPNVYYSYDDALGLSTQF